MQLLINLITISRIILAVIIFFLLTFPDKYILALIMFLFASISDFLDGYLARKYDQTSIIGEILDPIADKILVCFVLFGLSVNLSSYIIGFAGAIIISREIWVAALRDYNSRNNNTEATKVTFLAKIKTTTQLFAILIYLIALSLNNMLMIVIGDVTLISSIIITLYTGYQYSYHSLKK